MLQKLPIYKALSLVNQSMLLELKIWSLVQREFFGSENINFRKAMNLHNKNKLIGNSPFLDNDGIMHAKGRLCKADLEYQKTPYQCVRTGYAKLYWYQLSICGDMTLSQNTLPDNGTKFVGGTRKSCLIF